MKTNVERFQAAYDSVATFKFLNGGAHIGIKPFNLDGRELDGASVHRSGSVNVDTSVNHRDGLAAVTYYEHTNEGNKVTNDDITVHSDGITVWTSRIKTTSTNHPNRFIRRRKDKWKVERDIATSRLIVPGYVDQALEVIEYATGLRQRENCTVNRVSINRV